MTVDEVFYDPDIYAHSNKILWSKHGFIAYSCPYRNSQTNLCLTYLECIDGINWQLAPPKEFSIRPVHQALDYSNQITANPNFKPPPPPTISIVAYGPISGDLAVADELGNLTILATGVTKPKAPSKISILLTSFNELEFIYNDSQVENEHGHKLMGLKWFPLEKPLIVNGPSTRISTQSTPLPNGAASPNGAAFEDSVGQLYQYNIAQHTRVGPSHPLSTKQAFIGVRQNGEVTLWYQGEHGIDYFKASAFLETESKVNITRVAIGFTREREVVVAIHCDSDNLISLHKVEIDWGSLVYFAQMQKKMQNFVTPENSKKLPSLKIQRYMRELASSVDLKTGERQSLKILEMVSPMHSPSTELEILLGYETKTEGKTVSTVHILRIDPNPIANLFGKENHLITPFSATSFKTREIIRCPDLLLSIKANSIDSFLVFGYQNGEVQLYDRKSAEPVQNQFDERNTNMSFNNPTSLDQTNLELPSFIRSLIDSGFEIPKLGFQPSFVCVSPMLTSFIAMNPLTGKLVWTTFKRHLQSMVISDRKIFKKGFFILTASTFAFAHTSVCFSQSFTGDLITTIQTEVQRVKMILGEESANRLVLSILQESQRSINFQLDYTRENADKLLNHPSFQKLLCLQLSLGTSLNWQRNKSAQIAFYLLHLRLCSLIITLSLRTIYHQIQKESSSNRSNNLDDIYIKSNIVISAIGYVRWFLDYCIMLNQDLLETQEELVNAPQNKKKILDDHIAIPLIFNTVSRSLFLYCIASIRKLSEYSKKSVENIDSTNFKNFAILESFERLNAIIKSSPLKLEFLEKFIGDADSSIRSIKHDKSTSIRIETQLFCEGKIPDVYIERAVNFCSLYSEMSKKEFNLVDLYLYDFEWLNPNRPINGNRPIEIIEDTSEENHDLILSFKSKRNSMFLDELRKNLIISRSLRRCTLCGAVSTNDEVPLYSVDYISPTALPFQRTCFCSGYWVTL